MCTIHNIKAVGTKFDVYIGRPLSRHSDPRVREGSMFANVYRVGDAWKTDRAGRRRRDGLACATAEEAVERYERDLRAKCQDPAYRALVLELKGRRLACWCKPGPCHGDAIQRVILDIERGVL